MKRYEYLATEHAKRVTKTWDYFILACDSFLSGYKAALKDSDMKISYSDPYESVLDVGSEEVEVDIPDGQHQLSVASFNAWSKNRKEDS